MKTKSLVLFESQGDKYHTLVELSKDKIIYFKEINKDTGKTNRMLFFDDEFEKIIGNYNKQKTKRS